MTASSEEVALAIVKFLKRDADSPIVDPEMKDSLDIAIDCIQKAYKIEEKDTSSAADLPQLIAVASAQIDPKLAEKYRNEGNALMNQKKYMEALEAYNKAIMHEPSNHFHYGNRSVANLKLGRYSNAVEDANVSINLNPTSHRGYARKGTALMALGQYSEAKHDFEKALELDPTNEVYKDRLNQCNVKLSEIPNPETLFSGLGNLMNSPEILNAAQSLMSNPQMQEVMADMARSMSNPDQPFNIGEMMNAYQQAFQNFGGPPPPERRDPNDFEGQNDPN